jgi:hypothetical protein
VRVRLLVGFTGAISLQPGDEHDFPQDEAVRLVSAGFAVPVAAVTIETADAAPAPERRKRGPRNALA